MIICACSSPAPARRTAGNAGGVISEPDASQIVDAVMKNPAGTKVMVLSPLVRGQKGEHKETFGAIHKQGFVRARVDGQIVELPTAGDCAGTEEDIRT